MEPEFLDKIFLLGLGTLFGITPAILLEHYRRNRARKDAAGRAVSALLAIHTRVRAMRKTAQSNTKFSFPLTQVFEKVHSLDGLHLEYQRAIEQLAAVDPMLAYDLRERSVGHKVSLAMVNNVSGFFSGEIDIVDKARFLDHVLFQEEENIRQAIKYLSIVHSRWTAFRVNLHLLDRPIEPDPGVSRFRITLRHYLNELVANGQLPAELLENFLALSPVEQESAEQEFIKAEAVEAERTDDELVKVPAREPSKEQLLVRKRKKRK